MVNLEDEVREVVAEFLEQDVLFTALDVSNEVKKALPFASHRDVREEVRKLYPIVIESCGWTRTPITVNLSNGTTAQALLYHDLKHSWDLDNLYDAQQRTKTAVRPVAVAQAAVSAAANYADDNKGNATISARNQQA